MADATSLPMKIPVPDPDLTPADLVARAAALRPLLREAQEETEARGYYSEHVHEEIRRAGLYRVLQPRRFGGYEFDVPTFFRVVIELARADPGAGMCFSLATGHAVPVASQWSEKAQIEAFGPDGEFRSPHRAAPGGTARRVDGGFVLNGRWRYSTGIPYSTHFMGGVIVTDPDAPADKPPEQIVAIVPRGQFTMLEDWGAGRDLGMQGSGSNTVLLDEVFVPEHLTVPANWRTQEIPAEGTPGTRLHGNPMYIGRIAALYQGEHVSCCVGTARAALDEHERLLKTQKNRAGVLRYQSPDDQMAFGRAMTLADSAEATLIRVGEIHMDYCRAWAEEGRPFTPEDEARLHAMLVHVGYQAAQVVEIAFRYNGPDSAKRESPLNRYYRDIAMYGLHGSTKPDAVAQQVAQAHFGLPTRALRPGLGGVER